MASQTMAVLVGAGNIRIPLTSNVVDPRFFPRIVGGLLCVVAVLHAVTVARGNLGEPDEGEDVDLSLPTDYRSLFAVAASFIAHALLVDRVGWIPAAVVLFAGSAFGLGARKLIRVLVVALVTAKMTQAKERSVELRLSPSSRLRRCTDEEASELLTVLGTLVDNALQAVPPGGIIEISILEEAGWVDVTVTDSGPGIAPDLTDTVFEPGFTTKSGGDHAGLGLALAVRACAARGGALRLMSQNPTTFHARLAINPNLVPA